ncbi:MAG TPA: hypothetical protein VMN36_00055 [Verrucomicrobiales bacterium]|nr:hypothetical protein [Verrucomicrobiales bacterium]
MLDAAFRRRRFRSLLMLFAAGAALVAGACSSTGISPSNHPLVRNRDARIAQEPSGDHYIGRRYFVRATRFWGYLRKPRQGWDKAQLVIFNETQRHSPDRLPEAGSGTNRHGFDHNSEYRIYGHFTGESVYDPASNRVFPEFMLRNYELITRDPGFLFHPNESYDPARMPRENW